MFKSSIINPEYYMNSEISIGNTLDATINTSTLTIDEYLKYLISILFTLQIAQEQLGYMHHNLNSDNVILVSLSKISNGDRPFKSSLPGKNSVMYYHHGTEYHLITDKIPTIIDNKYSRIEYKHKAISESDNEKLFSPCADMYQYILYSLKDMSFQLYWQVMRIVSPFLYGDDFGVCKAFMDAETIRKSPNKTVDEVNKIIKALDFMGNIDISIPNKFNKKTPRQFLSYLKKKYPQFWNNFVYEKYTLREVEVSPAPQIKLEKELSESNIKYYINLLQCLSYASPAFLLSKEENNIKTILNKYHMIQRI